MKDFHWSKCYFHQSSSTSTISWRHGYWRYNFNKWASDL